MSAVTGEMLGAYVRAFNGDYCKNIEGFKTGIEALYKSITGSDNYKQIQALHILLNDPESSINKAMRMWSEFSKKIDYEKLTGVKAGLQQFTFQISKIDLSTFDGLQTNLDKLLNTENIISSKLSETIDYAYEIAKEEAGEPEINKEELETIVREEIKNDSLGEVAIENSKFKEKFYAFIKFFLIHVLLPLTLNFISDLGKAQIGKLIKFSAEDDAPVIYEIHNKNTYVNIIEQTDKQYHVFFIDDEGNVIDGYTDKENIDMNFEDDEDGQ